MIAKPEAHHKEQNTLGRRPQDRRRVSYLSLPFLKSFICVRGVGRDDVRDDTINERALSSDILSKKETLSHYDTGFLHPSQSGKKLKEVVTDLVVRV